MIDGRETVSLRTPDLNCRVRFTDVVIGRLHHWRRAGIKSALVTLVGVDGRSPRPIGSQMAVAETGEYVGQISAGCAEAAIVAEAMSAIAHNSNVTVRYGAGSKYLDVQLPCGSGIDVYFDSQIGDQMIADLDRDIQGRSPVTLQFDCMTHDHKIFSYTPNESGDQSNNSPSKTLFSKTYLPTTRLLVAGTGPVFSAVVEAAAVLDWEVVAASPDHRLLQAVSSHCRETMHLRQPADTIRFVADKWTASVTLFHDHDWEPPLLEIFLNSPGFFIGAMGSHATHTERCNLLRTSGLTEEQIARIRGPVGLDIGSATPAEIAISIIAEIISTRRIGRA